MNPEQVPRHTAAHVATKLKRSVSTIGHCALTHGIGTLVNPRMRLYSDADIEALKAVMKDGRGRPHKPAE